MQDSLYYMNVSKNNESYIEYLICNFLQKYHTEESLIKNKETTFSAGCLTIETNQGELFCITPKIITKNQTQNKEYHNTTYQTIMKDVTQGLKPDDLEKIRRWYDTSDSMLHTEILILYNLSKGNISGVHRINPESGLITTIDYDYFVEKPQNITSATANIVSNLEMCKGCKFLICNKQLDRRSIKDFFKKYGMDGQIENNKIGSINYKNYGPETFFKRDDSVGHFKRDGSVGQHNTIWKLVQQPANNSDQRDKLYLDFWKTKDIFMPRKTRRGGISSNPPSSLNNQGGYNNTSNQNPQGRYNNPRREPWYKNY